jgi:hypothetical protein
MQQAVALKYMKIKKKVLDLYKEKLIPLVKNKFERRLMRASIDNLKEHRNKLRFNNFAAGFRELSRHILHRLAPDEQIVKCVWYKNISGEKGKIARSERINYIIHQGLPDDYVRKEMDLDDYQKEIKDALDTLNKYVHVNNDTFDIPQKDVLAYSSQIIDAFTALLIAIEECKEVVEREISRIIDDAVLQAAIEESIDEIDILSTHHWIDETDVEKWQITEIDAQNVYITASGFLTVQQQYGSDSDMRNDIGIQFSSSFPFESSLTMRITSRFPKDKVYKESINVDTSSWYE